MKHYFNVCDVRGDGIEPVDIITFGSPCQDLSIAGKRAGLKHAENGDEETTRSGLFMEAVRIIKEMRNATNNDRPRFAVWENVPGAFSSGKGEDFRIVLEELAKIKDPTVSIPRPKDGKWLTAGQIMGNGFSIAWRTLDAQFWGVPQRRRRIYLVADFGGCSAGKILFESEGVSGDIKQSIAPRERTARNVEGGIRAAGFKWGQGAQARSIGYSEEVSPTLPADAGGNTAPAIVRYVGKVTLFEPRSQDGVPRIHEGWVSPTLNTAQGGQRQPCVAYSFDSLSSNSMKSSNPHSGCREVDVAKCLDTTDPNPSKNQGGVAVVQLCGDRDNPSVSWSDKAYCLPANPMSDRGQAVVQPTYCLQGNGIDRADTAGCNGKGWTEDVCYTLNTIDRPAVTTGINGDVSGTLDASYYKGTGARNGIEREVIFAMQRSDATDLIASVDCRNMTENADKHGTLQAKENGGQSLNYMGAIRTDMTVRRLTPTECARLQGFPDEWGKLSIIAEMSDEDYQFWTECRKVKATIDGKRFRPKTKEQTIKWYNKLHTDSAEYKMWGNGIALPCASYVLSGIANEGAKTLGSLFDGSGGFPLAGLIHGIKPLYSCEVEPYPVAVTKARFNQIK